MDDQQWFLENLDTLDQDEIPTLPSTPTARRGSELGLCFVSHCDERVAKLKRIGTDTALALAGKFRDIGLTIDSWKRCQPTDQIRRETLENLGRRDMQFDSLLKGER